MKKLFGTIKILYCLGMARTFGKYLHSFWDGNIHCARYRWKGNEWIVPLGYVGWNGHG